MLPIPPLTDFLLRKLTSIYQLDADDRAAINRLPVHVEDLPADRDIVREGEHPTRSCFLVSGMTCWSKLTGKGRRQILSFHVAGDLPDMQSVHLIAMDSTLTTLSPCRIAFVHHKALHEICAERPSVAGAFWRMTLIDAAIFREWVANVGGRQALARVSHVLCEMVFRLAAVGLAEGQASNLPITQSQLADATGMSAVHINRTLQTLRRKKLITWKNYRLEVMDWEGLKKAGDFDPSYLHLRTLPEFSSRQRKL